MGAERRLSGPGPRRSPWRRISRRFAVVVLLRPGSRRTGSALAGILCGAPSPAGTEHRSSAPSSTGGFRAPGSEVPVLALSGCPVLVLPDERRKSCGSSNSDGRSCHPRATRDRSRSRRPDRCRRTCPAYRRTAPSARELARPTGSTSHALPPVQCPSRVGQWLVPPFGVPYAASATPSPAEQQAHVPLAPKVNH